jgi:hypothetical protein
MQLVLLLDLWEQDSKGYKQSANDQRITSVAHALPTK